MPGTDAAEETRQEIRLADLLRSRRGQIVESVVAAVPERVPPFRAIPAEELAPVVGDYLDVLALAIELASTTPLETFVQSLDRDWPSARVPVDDVIRGFYVVGDCCRAALADAAGPDDLAALDAWTREGVALFSRFAVTFLTGRLAGEVARYRREEARLLSLQRVSAAVVGDLDLDRTLEVVVDEAARLMDAAAVSLRLLDEESGALRLIAAGGSGDALLYGESLPIEGSLAGLCLRCGQPLVATDTQSDPRLAPEVRAQSTLRSLLVAPLRVRDRVIGVLLVGDPRPGRFTEADGAFLGLFADQAASAIENATLYQQAQGQIEELAIVQRVTQSISRSLDLE
ncbi:MAG: GAF domain-containing protein, partial [Thermomicrobiaceae bacterium]|nr:GAF domain-containing protein [Thermomicrobiaceae bacterium]